MDTFIDVTVEIYLIGVFKKDEQLVSGRQSLDLNPGLILCKAHAGANTVHGSGGGTCARP